MTSRDFQDCLTQRASLAGITLPPQLVQGLEVYYRLLGTWNRRINLTALDVTVPSPDAVDRLLLEPLAAARHAPMGIARMVDIGSGGGSPAIPFALAVPGVRLLMVESKSRKSVFLREAARALQMDAEVATARLEDLLMTPDLHEVSDLVTIRAVRTQPSVILTAEAVLKPGGHVFLFKGASGEPFQPSTPSLVLKGTFPLIEAGRSRLLVLSKAVSRGTPM